MAVLAAAAGLAHVALLDLLDLLADRLAIGNLRLADVGIDLELAQHAIDEHLEVELAHSRDDRLARLVVGVDLERRVLLGQRLQRVAELVLRVLGLGLDGHVDHGLGELQRLEDDRRVGVAQRVARGGLLEADHGHDVAREDAFFVLAVVGVHLQDPADAFLAVTRRVEDGRALVQLAAVHAHVGELADVGVGHDLEGQRRERRRVLRRALELLDALDVDAGDRWQVDRAGQEVDHRVEHGLHALVLERRPAQDRHNVVRDGAGAERLAQVVGGDLLVAHVLLEDVLVECRQDVDQLVTVLGGLGLEVGRDLRDLPLLTHALLPDEALHPDEVDAAAVVALGTDRQLDDGGQRVESILDHVDGAEVVGADAVHLVDEADAGDAVLVRLSPHRLGLGLDAGHRVEHRDGTVEHAQAALHLDREVDVARRVDDVDPGVLPVARGGRRRDGDAALLLLHHPVHGGGALVHLTDLVVLAGVIEDPLRRGGLARVDVGHDPDVAGPGQRELSDDGCLSHDLLSEGCVQTGKGNGRTQTRSRARAPGCHPTRVRDYQR